MQAERAVDYGGGVSVAESPPFVPLPETWKELDSARDGAAAEQASTARTAPASVGANGRADDPPRSISANGAQALAAPAEGANPMLALLIDF